MIVQEYITSVRLITQIIEMNRSQELVWFSICFRKESFDGFNDILIRFFSSSKSYLQIKTIF